MLVQFTLTMDDLIVNGKEIDQVVIGWKENTPQKELLDISCRWITTCNFLTTRMVGLDRVGESSLTIEPLEESEVA